MCSTWSQVPNFPSVKPVKLYVNNCVFYTVTNTPYAQVHPDFQVYLNLEMMPLTIFRTIFSSLFSSLATMMNDSDPFIQLFTSESLTTMDTQTFQNHYINMILLSNEHPQNILNRFMVKSISLNKHSETTSQHECLMIEVYDAKLLNAKTHLVFLERTATSEVLPETTTIDRDFANHPDAHLIRDIIQKVLNSLSSSSSHPFNASKSDLTIPLIPITTPSQSSNSLPLTQLLLADATSLASTQAFVHKLSDSFLAKTRQAGDQG